MHPGAGTCTFSGHRRLSATNAPGRRHVATPRAHCTKVMSPMRLTPAAGSQPDMGSLTDYSSGGGTLPWVACPGVRGDQPDGLTRRHAVGQQLRQQRVSLSVR